MIDLIRAAEKVAADLTDTLDGDERIGYLDVLDALASAGLTLTVDDERTVSNTYIEACEMEGLLRS